jgi:MFS family permease
LPRSGAALLKNRDFVKLWAARSVSDFGSLMSGTALSFTAILYLKATPGQLGVLMATNLAPRFLVGPAAGLLADRLPRRLVMVGADLGRALLLSTIPLAAILGRLNIWHLYLVTSVSGLLTLLFDIADRAYLPTLVPPEDLVQANSRLTATSSVAEFGAFSLGGWLVQWFSGPIAVVIDAATFLFSAVCLGTIGTREPPNARLVKDSGILGDLSDAWKSLRADPTLRTLASVTLLVSLTGGIEGAVIVAFMARGLGFRPGVLGMIWSVGGFASLLGALLATRVLRWMTLRTALALSLVVSAAGVFAITLGRGATWMSGALLIANQLFTDSAYTIYEIHQTSARQAAIPGSMQGRINGLFETLGIGATLAGALIGGLLGERLGLRAAVAIGACGYLAGAVVIWASPLGSSTQISATDQDD